MNWFSDRLKGTEKAVSSLWSNEDEAIIQFFTPLMRQVKATALQLGKDNLQAGIKILQDAAIAAALSAATAPPGSNKAVVAETTFATTLASEGITQIHNAEAGAIKAAVAMLQTQTPVTITSTLPLAGATPNLPVANT